MWTYLSVSRWIFLLTLAAVMFLSVSQVNSYVPNISLSCCENITERRIRKIKECYEQTPRDNCKIHAFMIINKKGRWCINSTSEWLTSKIQRGELNCPPILSLD